MTISESCEATPTSDQWMTSAEAEACRLELEEDLQTNRCPEPDAYGMCVCCGHRYKVSCVCGTTFAERARLVNIDTETLRKFHGT